MLKSLFCNFLLDVSLAPMSIWGFKGWLSFDSSCAIINYFNKQLPKCPLDWIDYWNIHDSKLHFNFFIKIGMEFGMIHDSNITLLNTFQLAPRVKGLKYVRVWYTLLMNFYPLDVYNRCRSVWVVIFCKTIMRSTTKQILGVQNVTKLDDHIIDNILRLLITYDTKHTWSTFELPKFCNHTIWHTIWDILNIRWDRDIAHDLHT
jgi:hypothetical protein